MTPPEKAPTISGLWMKSLELIRRNPSAWLQIGIKLIFLPWLLLILVQGWKSRSVTERLGRVAITSYTDLMDGVGPFLSFWLISGCLFLSLLVSGFFSFIQLAVWELQDKPLSARAALKRSLKLLFPGGLLLMLFLSLLSLEQAVFGPFRILTLFASMACVIMVADGKKAPGALKHALLLRYCSPVFGGAPVGAFILFGLSAIIFTAEYGISLLYRFILNADEVIGISRKLWLMEVAGTPMSLMCLVANTMVAFGLATVLAFTASYLVCFYYSVRSSVHHLV